MTGDGEGMFDGVRPSELDMGRTAEKWSRPLALRLTVHGGTAETVRVPMAIVDLDEGATERPRRGGPIVGCE